VDFESIEAAPDKPLPRDVALASIKGISRGSLGRKHTLTDEVAIEILQRVSEGSFLTTAAGCANVDPQTVHEWLRRGLADTQAGLDSIFGRFAEGFAQAQHSAEQSAVAALQRGGDGKFKDWRAQAWWLERRHKERWSLPKEQGIQGITLQLSNEQLAALSDALRVGAALDVTPDKPDR